MNNRYLCQGRVDYSEKRQQSVLGVGSLNVRILDDVSVAVPVYGGPATALDRNSSPLYLQNDKTMLTVSDQEVRFTIPLAAGTQRLPADRMKDDPIVA